MTGQDLSYAAWRKSSRSATANNCVEVAAARPGIAVRDSRNPTGPRLAFTGRGWRGFASGAKHGTFDAGLERERARGVTP